MTIDEFVNEFKRIKAMGFVPSKRQGPTGVGHTFEGLLDLTENNSTKPDIEGAEIKAHRTKSNSMVTLFTFNRKAWQMPPLEAVKKYGSLDREGRQGLYYTMSLKPNSAGLFLFVEESKISVQHISGQIVATWQLETLVNRFQQKIPALIFVSAFTETRDGMEYFHYYRAQLMKDTSAELLANQFRAENILVDLRLHDKNTRARNHGTGFRAYEDNFPLLFSNIRDL